MIRESSCHSSERRYCLHCLQFYEPRPGHSRVREYIENLNCYRCNQKYMVSVELDAHMRSAYSHAQNQHCDFPLADLIREGQRQHRERCPQNFHCRTCFERFETWTERYQHEKLNHFLCACCPQRTFDTFEAFTLHRKTQHSELWCDLCNRDLESRSLLEIHQKTQHSETWCNICHQSLKSKGLLEIHKKSQHSETWCDFCNRDLESKDLLKIHKNSAGCRRPRQAKKTSTSQWTTWYCVDCKRQFKSQDGFRVHKEFIHRSRDARNSNNESKTKSSSSTWHQAPGYCPDCEADYITRERLQEHINRRHNQRSAKPPPEPSWKPKQHVPPLQHHIPQNFYDRLGISPYASQFEISKAARMKRIKTHPDKVKREGMTDIELAAIDTRAKAVGEAADVLGDERKRREYDRRLRDGRVR